MFFSKIIMLSFLCSARASNWFDQVAPRVQSACDSLNLYLFSAQTRAQCYNLEGDYLFAIEIGKL